MQVTESLQLFEIGSRGREARQAKEVDSVAVDCGGDDAVDEGSLAYTQAAHSNQQLSNKRKHLKRMAHTYPGNDQPSALLLRSTGNSR